MKRTAEFVLGLIGGIFGIICAFVALLIGGMGAAFEADGANTVIGLGWGAVALSILGIVGSVMVRRRYYDDCGCYRWIYLYFYNLLITRRIIINRWVNGHIP
ncbi:unnamed protein product [Bacillus thuringiensis DB27]|uniref:DUF4064 domain-containing protein n=1 Tax=Bacillus thuringiensis DB27 TaxID=1431339 RepID=W8YTX6_BACTU|nr:unnamed protein product [Bacillus thuringiensis DB27]